jgi:hypoxanthine phosphoribosyltransferase
VTELKVLISREQLAKRVGEIGTQISRDFAGEAVMLVGVLKGAAVFLADLARTITLDATFDFIGVSSYGNVAAANEKTGIWESTGEARLTKDIDHPIKDRNVILVEDILDTGLTLTYLRNLFQQRHPRALRIAVLLDKPERRKKAISADYVGFEIPNAFVVGYGLDCGEKYRNLPDVCVIEPSQ